MDALVISDLHLGSPNCQVNDLLYFLENIHDTQYLVLNGDVFDSMDFTRLGKKHWKVLSTLRKLSDKIKIIWIAGNHDGPAEVLSHLVGLNVEREFIFKSGDNSILFLHGDVFDSFLTEHPFLTWLGDLLYLFLQKIDRSHYFARAAKHNSKVWLHCTKKIKAGATKRAVRHQCQIVCVGHTHHAEQDCCNGIVYFNSGCWTERQSTYLAIENGHVEIVNFRKLS